MEPKTTEAEFQLQKSHGPPPWEVIQSPERQAEIFHGTGEITEAMLARAETAIKMAPRVRQLAFQRTDSVDWVQMQGPPGQEPRAYCTDSGCEKIAGLFGVTSFPGKMERLDGVVAGEPRVEYRATVTVEYGGRTVTEVGVVDSDMPFYKGSNKNGKEFIPFQERKFTVMQKHAMTNAYGRAIRNLFGLSSIPWSEIQQALGAKAGKVAAVEYKRPEGAAPAPTAATVEQKATDLSHREELKGMLLDLALGDPVQANALLMQRTSFQAKDGNMVPGVSSVDDPRLTRPGKDGSPNKWMPATVRKIREEWTKAGFTGVPGQGSGGDPFSSPPQREPGEEG